MMTEPTSPLTTAQLPEVAAEAEAIRDLLVRHLPSYAQEHRAVAIGQDESPLIHAFWGAVGWSAAFGRCQLEEPEIAMGVQRAWQRLAEYRRDDPGFTITETDLPARHRLVHLDTDGIGFTITDECDDVADPPLLDVLWDANSIVAAYPSYLNWCANAIVTRAFGSWGNTVIRLADLTALHTAPSPFPTLSPATRQLGSQLWLTAETAALPAPGTPMNFAAARLDALVEWLFDHDTGGLDIGLLPGEIVRRAGPLALRPGVDSRLRVRPGLHPGRRYHLGWIAGLAVIVKEDGHRTEIGVDPRHAGELEAWWSGFPTR